MALNRKTAPETLARAAELISQGLTVTETARRLGCHRSTLARRLGHRPDARNQKIAPETLARAAELIAGGMSLRQAAREVNVSHPTLLKWLGPGLARSQHDTTCARLCQHWTDGACGLGFPREDWAVASCGSHLRRW